MTPEKQGPPGERLTGGVDVSDLAAGSRFQSTTDRTETQEDSLALQEPGELLSESYVSRNGHEPPPLDALPVSAEYGRPEVEQAVLSALLTDPNAFDKVSGYLFPEHFTARNGIIYRVICDLRDSGQPADYVTVPDELQRLGRYDEVGGDGYLLGLGVDHGSWWSVEEYARRLVDHSAKARAARVLQSAYGRLHQPGVDLPTTLAGIQAELDELRGAHITVSDLALDAETATNTLFERLIVPMPEFDGLGTVGTVTDLIYDLTGSARSFCLLTALTVTAAATQRRARFRPKWGDVYPNIYGSIVAPTSVHHKSTAMNKGRDLLWRANLSDLLVPSQITTEGLLNRLSSKPSGLLFRDEVGTLFGSHQVKYLIFLKQDLMALYECQPHSRETAGKGEVKVNEPFLSILGTTTPETFFAEVSDRDWGNGFLVRWLVALPDASPDFDDEGDLLTESDIERMNKAAVALANLSRQPVTDFAVDQEAFAAWRSWRKARRRAAYQSGDDLALALAERYATYALKLSLVLAAANNWGSISTTNMAAGMALAEYFEGCLLTLRKTKEAYSLSGGKLQKAFAVIRDAGPNGIRERDVYRTLNMPKSEWEPVADKLLEIGAVIELNPKRGRMFKAATSSLPVRVW